MILEAPVYIVMVCITVLVFWLIPHEKNGIRAAFIAAVSVLIVALASPVVVFYVSISTFFIFLCQKFLKVSASLWIPVIFSIILFSIFLLTRKHFDGSIIDLVGVAFATLKQIAYVFDIYREKRRFTFMDTVLYIFYFPSFAIGPITAPTDVQRSKFATQLDVDKILSGIYRISVGSFKYFLIVGVFLVELVELRFPDQVIYSDQLTIETAFAFAILKFLALYLSFSGLTDIAIGVSLLFGVKLPENFNKPFFAHSIQDFWRKWHMSLISFTSKYIFLPLVRNTASREASVVIVFVLIGAWHSLSLNYLIWGIVHGGLLALVAYLNRQTWFGGLISEVLEKSSLAPKFWRFCTWFVTLTFVSVLSTFATSPSFADGIAFLVGFTRFD